MKSMNNLVAASLLVLLGATAASAATTVYRVTGSTAFRNGVVTAEVAYCSTGTTTSTAALATWYGPSSNTAGIAGASYSVVENQAGTVVFENFFNGSIGGLLAITKNSTLAFPAVTTGTEAPSAVTWTGVLTSKPSGGTGITSTYSGSGAYTPTTGTGNGPQVSATGAVIPSWTVTDNAYPDIGMSDVSWPTADQFVSQTGTTATPSNATGGSIVGIVPFDFVANSTTNVASELAGQSVSPQLFNQLWQNGTVPLSFVTGNTADSVSLAYAFGRDIDSGTRATALAETGYGLTGSGAAAITPPVTQYFPYATAAATQTNAFDAGVVGYDATLTNPTIGGVNQVPDETIDGIDLGQANGGYYSGANLSTALSTAFASSITVPNGTGGYTTTSTLTMVGYLGAGDAKNAVTASGTNRQAAILLGYNGATWSPSSSTAANSALIYSGRYTYWSYEHLFYSTTNNSEGTTLTTFGTGGTNSGVLGGTGANAPFGDGLVTALYNGADTTASNGVAYQSMVVQRSDDGLAVTKGKLSFVP